MMDESILISDMFLPFIPFGRYIEHSHSSFAQDTHHHPSILTSHIIPLLIRFSIRRGFWVFSVLIWDHRYVSITLSIQNGNRISTKHTHFLVVPRGRQRQAKRQESIDWFGRKRMEIIHFLERNKAPTHYSYGRQFSSWGRGWTDNCPSSSDSHQLRWGRKVLPVNCMCRRPKCQWCFLEAGR